MKKYSKKLCNMNSLMDFLKLKKENSFNIFQIDDIILTDEVLIRLFLELHYWVDKNATGNIYIFNMNPIWGIKTQKYDLLLLFENNVDYSLFKEWYKDFSVEFNNLPMDLKSGFFNNKESFYLLIDREEKIQIKSVIPYSMNKLDTQFMFQEDEINLWLWIKENLSGKIWRWDGKFRFELEEDAIAFKLAWC